MPDNDRDQYLWAEFAREAMGQMMKDYSIPDVARLAAALADEMMLELRRRFPGREKATTETSGGWKLVTPEQ